MTYDVSPSLHHAADVCVPPCPFHAPSDHRMKEWPKVIRETALIERQCPHGIGHPDPDSIAYFERHGRYGFGTHGCDGCCRGAGDKAEAPFDE